MKRYDKREVMKSAWRLYKWIFKTWSVVKFNSSFYEKKVVKPVEKVVKSESYQWPTSVNASAIYPDNSRGLMGSKYCGD